MTDIPLEWQHDLETTVPNGAYCRKCGEQWNQFRQVSPICKGRGGSDVTVPKELLAVNAAAAIQSAQTSIEDASQLARRVAETDREIEGTRSDRYDLVSLFDPILKNYQIERERAFQKFLEAVDPKYCSRGDHVIKKGRTRLIYLDYIKTYSHRCHECDPPDTHERFQVVHSACDEHIWGAVCGVTTRNGRIYLVKASEEAPFPRPKGWGYEYETVSTPAFDKFFDYQEVQKTLPPEANTVEELQKIVQQPAS